MDKLKGMLKISERDKKLLVVVLAVLIMALAYFFGFQNLSDQVDTLSTKKTTLETTQRDLKEKNNNKQKYVNDTMNYIKCDVSTICMGMAASMGAFLLSSGAKGKRICLPNAEVMIHQPLGRTEGQATEIEIAANHILQTKKKLNSIMAENCGKTVEELTAATDRDNWLTAQEALEFGLVDKVIDKR